MSLTLTGISSLEGVSQINLGVLTPITRLLISYNATGFDELYLVELSGLTFVSLTKISDSKSTTIESARISPNGRKILFTSDKSGKNELYELDTAKETIRQVTSTTSTYTSRQGDWSPDGTKICFVSNMEGFAGNGRVYTMNYDPDNTVTVSSAGIGTTFTRINTDNYSQSPKWNNFNTKIAYQHRITGGSNDARVFTINADGTNRTQITNVLTDTWRPDWSKDDLNIVYLRQNPAGVGQWQVIKDTNTGSSPTALTSESSLRHITPTYSSDNTYIFYGKETSVSSSRYGIFGMLESGLSKTSILTPTGTASSQVLDHDIVYRYV